MKRDARSNVMFLRLVSQALRVSAMTLGVGISVAAAADRVIPADGIVIRNATGQLMMQQVEPRAGWKDLRVGASTEKLLRKVAASRAKGGGGVLFRGPDRAAQARAAEVLATELRLPLYRVDLSAVVSEYIGETEKNLGRIFDAAEQLDAILFFDEADALFGKRTNVKNSRDRYANQEVSYLLQRIEESKGMVILASNRPEAVDPAVLRRFRQVVEFGPVAPE